MIEFKAPRITAPDGSIIGVIETGNRSMHAAGVTRLAPGEPMPDRPGNYILDHTLSSSDAVAKSRAVSRLIELRRLGATIVLFSHDELLLESCADEIWWVRDGHLVSRGDPAELLAQYRRHIAEAIRASGDNQAPVLSPAIRNGDGRAVLTQVELLGENGAPTTVFRSGENVAIRVTVRFLNQVADPVIGILIRTRIGLNVYGTNTELENLRLGPVAAGNSLRVTYRFKCDLCNGDYTVTAASHDPDGLWHDWLEDAVGFAVSDSRYTAGVANLRARVEAETFDYGKSAST